MVVVADMRIRDSDRQESQIKDIQEKIEKIKGEIIKIQTSAQAQGAGGAPGGAPAGAVKA